MTRGLSSKLAVLSVAVLAVAACGDDPTSSTGAARDDALSIVASTNVYGDIAAAVAGDRAEVTSIITSAAQDPHEYEASVQDRLALDGADVVLRNGGGFDPFVDTLLEAGSTEAVVLDAVEISGLGPQEEAHEGEAHEEEGHDHVEGLDEHVWYDLHSVEKVAEELSRELGALDPDNAATYEANFEAFAGDLEDLEASAASLRRSTDGRGVAITEPVPLYLLTEVGLVNRTPEEFSEAVEEGADVPPRALQETLDLVGSREVAVLAYNAQAADSTTEQVREAAEAAGVAVVDFTETLPEGQSYVEWQQANLDNLSAALGDA